MFDLSYSNLDLPSATGATAEQMLAMIAEVEADLEGQPEHCRRSRQRSAAVLLAALFNEALIQGYVEEGPEEEDSRNAIYTTMYAVQVFIEISMITDIVLTGGGTRVPCLDDVVLEYAHEGDFSDMTMVIFGLPEGTPDQFGLARVSPTKWEYNGFIQLPDVIPDLTIVIKAEILGDVAFTSLSSEEIQEAKSAPTPEDSGVRRFRERQGSTVIIRRYFGNDGGNQSTKDGCHVDEAIALFSRALELIPPLNPNGPKGFIPLHSNKNIRINTLFQLGKSLCNRYTLSGNGSDVDVCIRHLEEALELCTRYGCSAGTFPREGFAQMPLLLASAQRYLAVSYTRRYDTVGTLEA
ncbi:hypothetical protein NMY22_g11134 [Coprinellus aureogranulatus]|nr:hypothetical protein NMY22_g11134 [Coprinellus aureogranulatus]